MARDSVLVVWSEEEAYYLHCLSLSHKQLPEVTYSIVESGACVQKLLRNTNVIIRVHNQGRQKMRGRHGARPVSQRRNG